VSKLFEMKCVACRGGEPTLDDTQIQDLMPQVPGWQVIDEQVKKLARTYKFKNFIEALKFTNQVGELAEEQDHHPLLQTEWGKVEVVWWTHKIHGLHKNDFIMAAKTDQIFAQNWAR
jgi:4a-hydroxytetrahydrobiopterin dehydratase